MAEFSVEYINPFLMAATSVIKDICQVDMKIGRPYVKTTEFASDSVINMIGVTGEVRGQVLMSFPEAHALHVASKMMMGMPVTALDDMSASAINELGNMMMEMRQRFFRQKALPWISHRRLYAAEMFI